MTCSAFLPLLVFIGLFVWLSRSTRRQMAGGIMGIGGSKAKVYDEDKPVHALRRHRRLRGRKARGERGRRLPEASRPLRQRPARSGPAVFSWSALPVRGKTLMARAVAGEAEVPFFALTGSSFVEMFVGVGASRVRDLFADARKRAPSIIFIDEIDAIGQQRGGSIVSNDEREQTLNQLLAEMDGFDPTTGVVVMAATNRPEVLDPALMRPGRFDRQVEIPLPNQAERAAILDVHVEGKHLGPDVDLDAVSRGTPGFSGRTSPTSSTRRPSSPCVTTATSSRPRTSTRRGTGSSWAARWVQLPLPEEKYSVAVHETGHALVAVLSEHADPVAKITILPGRAGARGDRAAPARRTPSVPGELSSRLARHPPRWTSLRGPRPRRGLHGCLERSRRGDTTRRAHGPRLGTFTSARPDRLRR